MPPDSSIVDLMTRLHAGDTSAAGVIFRRFYDRVEHEARKHLAPALRRRVEPDDIAQSVFRTFFRRCAEGQFEVTDPDDLGGLLYVLTIRKCAAQADYHQAARRDIRRDSAAPAVGTEPAWDVRSRDPSPSEQAMLTELLASAINGLEGQELAIVKLRLEGHSPGDIKATIDCSERTVFRVLQRARKRIKRVAEGQNP